MRTFLEKKSLDDRHMGDFAIVHPVQVDSTGTFVSHQLTPARRKRSLEDDLDAGPIHYKLTANDQNFHLELRASENLLAPGFRIERWWKDRSIKEEYIPELHNCHYHGRLLSHPSSSAAVSLCDGMVGLLRTASDDYLIEPLPSHLERLFSNTTSSSESRPHIIYKRSVTSVSPAAAAHNTTQQQTSEHHGNGTRTKKSKTAQHFCGKRKKFQPHPPQEPIYFVDEFPEAPNRTKRSLMGDIHQNRFVETLVVVDPPMVKNHTSEKVATYVLSVLNIVANLYRDASLGSTINIVLVNLILLEEDQPGLEVVHHADRSLNSFCQWQSALTSPNGTRHDHAMLLTGKDICSWKNEPCDTLGYAPIGGMCSKYRSCTINEDTGIGLAFTIAHESGHSFSMVHDGDGNGCRKHGGNIMSPTLSGHTGRFSWSQCSGEYLNEFLQSDRAYCTENEPELASRYAFPTRLPGEIYSADQQCQWQFGAKARLCSFNFGKSICKSIWCHKGERRCETKFLPAADGTPCGVGVWCIQGECLLRGEKGPPPVDGGWSDYGGFQECSTSCGGGVQFKVRQCDNPAPQNGGKYCEGPSKIYQMCNTQECEEGAVDFRTQQCASYNSRPFRGYFYEWQPYTHVIKSERCKLYCIADGFSFYFALAAKVIDGTKCEEGSSDACVNGKCEHVGCDNVLGSNAEPDACGVCQGNNATCDFISGTYSEQFTQNDYYEVVLIPAGARHIRVAEKAPSESYLALRNTRFQYYLTGSWMVDWPGEFHFAGTTFTYERSFQQPETLTAPGPTTEDLVVEILLRETNPGITYEYTIQVPMVTTVQPLPVPVYRWNTTTTTCSVTCGGGVKRNVVTCVQDNTTIVDDSFCSERNKPSERVRACSQVNCPARWVTAQWRECNQQCGGGLQKRSVFCVRTMADGRNKTVKNRHCKRDKPRRWQSCNIHDCPSQWQTGGWSECSRTCADGFRERPVTCISMRPTGQHVEKADSDCADLVRPKNRIPCMEGRCPLNVQWFISAWGSCSQTCGPGIRTRIIKCSHVDDQGQYRELPEDQCSHIARPNLATTKPCTEGVCRIPRERGQWTSEQWSECSVSCGGGTKTRTVRCVGTGNSAYVECDEALKPSLTQICATDTCSSLETSCVDEYHWCNLVPNYNMCSHVFYGGKCCYSCRNANT
ncbi:A disintegrin and metalloproteinase with thrombospondin motifs 18-like isoform X2 [Apostichopus japonicus]